jgi:tol-pal system protein YbgF
MRKVSLLLLGMIVPVALTGCATRRQVLELQLQVEAIRADQAEIRAQNTHLDSLFRANIEQSRRLNADFADYVSQLDQRMQIVEARLEDAITLINRAAGAIESRGGRNFGPGQADTSRVDSSRQSGGIDCQRIYNAAYGDFVKERYDMAINGFRSMIQACPTNALADNAQYWIGECYLSQKQYAKAQQAFEVMLDKYPASERIAAAKLKLGRSLYEQRLRAKARQYFEDVVKNYPGTDEAQEAAQMLERYR